MTLMTINPALRADNWRDRAACIGQADVFLPRDERYANPAKARRICGGCPVREACLAAAMEEEEKSDQYRRAGIRGGLDPLERAALAGCVQKKVATEQPMPEERGDYAELERVLREGKVSDTAAAASLGFSRSTVSAFRRELGIPAFLDRLTPQAAFDRGAHPVAGGHVEWGTRGRQVSVHGRTYDLPRLAFLLGHGREAEGSVKVTCGHVGCLAWQHLADRAIRHAERDA
ncbi:WhiB family transcriptional regulator [Streptomyces sp. NPDC002467]|uniref:WhiB family transcriptional regulator n=1 Tax=Streptomyces sp. NPDC002467 TaxID=3364647 RepID=UPI0036C52477